MNSRGLWQQCGGNKEILRIEQKEVFNCPVFMVNIFRTGYEEVKGTAMKIGITYRLFLAILAAAGLAVASMLLIMQWSIDRGFLRYVNSMEQTRLSRLAEALEKSYAGAGNWDFLKNDPEQWQIILAASIPEGEQGPPELGLHGPRPGPPPNRDKGRDAGPFSPPFPRGFDMRFFLLNAGKKPLFAQADIPDKASLKPLRYHDRIIGYVGLLPRQRLSDERQLRFLKEQRLALGLVGGVVLLLAAGFSLPLANRLVRPIKALAAASDRLAAGDFSTRVPVTSVDELGHLARDFNALALTLEKNEQARRQWVADISHELRTPLAVLRGEIEALQDGVRQPSPDSINSLHCEVMRLGRLVSDLYQLSLSDLGALTYRKEEINLAQLLTAALASYSPEFAAKKIALVADILSERAIMVFGDPERLHQLFANLLDNSLKYTDPGGKLEVRLACRDKQVTIAIRDSAPGIPDGELDKLFKRLYRFDASRNRSAGGAGLGLAICRNIVEAHTGTITAHTSPLGGIWIRIMLPLSGKS
jgi:two-component system sensor histidine kinase BaeS